MPVVGSKVFCGLITSVDLKKVLFALGISLSSLWVFRNSCPDANEGAVQYEGQAGFCHVSSRSHGQVLHLLHLLHLV